MATKEELIQKRDEILQRLRKIDGGSSVSALVSYREERKRLHAELDAIEIAIEEFIEETRTMNATIPAPQAELQYGYTGKEVMSIIGDDMDTVRCFVAAVRDWVDVNRADLSDSAQELVEISQGDQYDYPSMRHAIIADAIKKISLSSQIAFLQSFQESR